MTTPLTHVEGLPLLGGHGALRVLQQAANGVLLEIHYPSGVASQIHAHDHDSVVYLLSGRLTGTVDGVRVELNAGESVVHPRGTPHSVEAVEDSRWLEFKSPPPDLGRTLGLAP